MDDGLICSLSDCDNINPQPKSNFHRKAASKTGYVNVCKDCKKKYDARRHKSPEYRKKTNEQRAAKSDYKEQNRKNNLKKYNMTQEQYDEMLEAQGGVCCICLEFKPFRGEYMVVDHCHETGKVRGILCMTCNSGLGHFKDSHENLERATEYLKAHGRYEREVV